tara:strand:+ start:705 stop:1589 length:885 start_codon:yes stop_codon:yes gene_type:complete
VDTSITISQIYSRTRTLVDTDLEQEIQSLDISDNLSDAIRYALLSGGKRVRPALAMQAAYACGGSEIEGLAAGASTELIHAFSLIHDDLPALDNDDLRRGQLTVHKKYGEAMGILAGDLLLTMAFRRITRSEFSSNTQAFMTKLLAEATAQMVSGQVLDTIGHKDTAQSKDLVLKIHTQKTGALITAACIMGAKSVTDDSKKLDSIKIYGESIGLGYQIIDDLIDLESSVEKAGKKVRKDNDANKCTWPLAYGVKESKREAGKLVQKAINAVMPLGKCANGLIQLANSLTYRSY